MRFDLPIVRVRMACTRLPISAQSRLTRLFDVLVPPMARNRSSSAPVEAPCIRCMMT